MTFVSLPNFDKKFVWQFCINGIIYWKCRKISFDNFWKLFRWFIIKSAPLPWHLWLNKVSKYLAPKFYFRSCAIVRRRLLKNKIKWNSDRDQRTGQALPRLQRSDRQRVRCPCRPGSTEKSGNLRPGSRILGLLPFLNLRKNIRRVGFFCNFLKMHCV